MVLFQTPSNDWSSWISFLIFWGLFFYFYPRLMLMQIMWKLENVTQDLEKKSLQAKEMIISEVKGNKRRVRERINRFMEFFAVMPVSLDPFGIIKKIEHIVVNERNRFRYFVNTIAPSYEEEDKRRIEMGIVGSLELYNIAKILRHYVELIKKTKSYQIALIIQMQIPLIERIAKALFSGTGALLKGKPIGDGIGPYIVSKLITKKDKVHEIEEDTITCKKKLWNKSVVIVRAKGPGGRVGRIGKVVEKIVKKSKVLKIVTIDAAAKLEGEVTGSVAEGIGVAMGGIGVERSYIEDVAVRNNIPLDAIVVKMSPEEAIMPMKKAIIDAENKVLEYLRESIERERGNGEIVIVGVGNSSGIGNRIETLDSVRRFVKSVENKEKKRKKK